MTIIQVPSIGNHGHAQCVHPLQKLLSLQDWFGLWVNSRYPVVQQCGSTMWVNSVGQAVHEPKLDVVPTGPCPHWAAGPAQVNLANKGRDRAMARDDPLPIHPVFRVSVTFQSGIYRNTRSQFPGISEYIE